MSTDTQSLQKEPPFIPAASSSNSFWSVLIEPSKGLVESGARRRARLLAAMSLALAVTLILGGGLSFINNPSNTNAIILFGVGVLSTAVYIFSRTRRYAIGSTLVVLIFTAGMIAVGSNAAPDRIQSATISFLPFTFVLAAALLSYRGLIAIFIANLAGIAILPLLNPAILDGGDMIATIGVSAVLGIVTIITVNQRNRIEQDRLAALAEANKELNALKSQMEIRIADRTRELSLAAEVGRALSQVQDPEALLFDAVELIRERFDLYYTQIYLTDPSGSTLKLRAGTGKVGQQLLERGHTLPIGPGSINGDAAATNTPVIVQNTETDDRFFANPLLPDTRSEIAVPLIVGERVVGVLDMQSDQTGKVDEETLPAFETLAAQLAIAIDNARLFEETERAVTEQEAQARLLARQNWGEYLNTIDRSAWIGYSYEHGDITPLDTPVNHTSSNEQSLDMPIRVADEPVGALQIAKNYHKWTQGDKRLVGTITDQLARHIENLRLLNESDRYRYEAELATRRLTTQGWEDVFRSDSANGFVFDQKDVLPLEKSTDTTAPLVTNDLKVRGETVGRLEIADTAELDEDSKHLVSAVAEQLSAHIENLRLTERSQRNEARLSKQAIEMQTVSEVSTTTSTILESDKLLQTVVDLVKDRFNLYHAHIYTLDPMTNLLHLAVGAGDVGRQMVEEKRTIPFSQEQSLVARAARTKRGLIVNNVQAEQGFLPHPLLPETRSELAVPMVVGEQVLGVLDLQASQTNHFSAEDLVVQTALAAQIAVALQNANLYSEQTATVERLRELDHLKSSFLANMSHELRTPLNSIIGFTDVMLAGLDGPLTDDMETDLTVINKNGKHLLSLINDVLDMAKIEAGRMNLIVEAFDLQELLREVVDITLPLAREKDLALEMKFQTKDGFQISADHTRLRQVLLNLLSNSIKFTEQGGVTLRTESKNDRLRIEVQDTGLGVPKENKETIFEMFGQVDTTTTRKAGGTGLGLPISRRLVELHNGMLWVESEGIPGEGSTFIIELPMKTETTEA